MEKRLYKKMAERAPRVNERWTYKWPEFYKEGVNELLEKEGIMGKFKNHSVTLLEVGVGRYHWKKEELGIKHVLKKFRGKLKEAFILEPHGQSVDETHRVLSSVKGFKLSLQRAGKAYPPREPAGEGVPEIKLVQANLFSSLPTKRADVTICSRVIDQYTDHNERHALLFNLLLATKPGGYLILDSAVFINKRDEELFTRLDSHGLKLLKRKKAGYWDALLFQKPHGKEFDRKIHELIKKLGD